MEGRRYALAAFSEDLQALGGKGRPGGVPHMVDAWRTHAAVKAQVQYVQRLLVMYVQRLLLACDSVGPLHLALLGELAASSHFRAERAVEKFAGMLRAGLGVQDDGAALMGLVSNG